MELIGLKFKWVELIDWHVSGEGPDAGMYYAFITTSYAASFKTDVKLFSHI